MRVIKENFRIIVILLIIVLVGLIIVLTAMRLIQFKPEEKAVQPRAEAYRSTRSFTIGIPEPTVTPQITPITSTPTEVVAKATTTPTATQTPKPTSTGTPIPTPTESDSLMITDNSVAQSQGGTTLLEPTVTVTPTLILQFSPTESTQASQPEVPEAGIIIPTMILAAGGLLVIALGFLF